MQKELNPADSKVVRVRVVRRCIDRYTIEKTMTLATARIDFCSPQSSILIPASLNEEWLSIGPSLQASLGLIPPQPRVQQKEPDRRVWVAGSVPGDDHVAIFDIRAEQFLAEQSLVSLAVRCELVGVEDSHPAVKSLHRIGSKRLLTAWTIVLPSSREGCGPSPAT